MLRGYCVNLTRIIEDKIEEVRKMKRKLSKKELREIVARGYCTKRNSKKVVDADLLDDIVEALKRG